MDAQKIEMRSHFIYPVRNFRKRSMFLRVFGFAKKIIFFTAEGEIPCTVVDPILCILVRGEKSGIMSVCLSSRCNGVTV